MLHEGPSTSRESVARLPVEISPTVSMYWMPQISGLHVCRIFPRGLLGFGSMVARVEGTNAPTMRRP